MPTVRAGRGGSKPIGLMGPLMRLGNGGRPLPKQLTVVPIEAEEFELKRRKAARILAIDRDGRRHKDLIFPDDRRRKVPVRELRPSI